MGVGTPVVHSDCHTTTRSFSSSFVLPARGKAGGCPRRVRQRRQPPVIEDDDHGCARRREPAPGTVPAASNRASAFAVLDQEDDGVARRMAEGRTPVPGATSHTVTRSFRMIGVPASAPVSVASLLTTSATAVATRPAHEGRPVHELRRV